MTASRPISRSFSELQEGPRTGPKMSLRMDPKGTENGLPKGAQRGLSKPDFKRLFSEKFCNIASLLIVSRCIASCRANVRSGPQSVQETEAGQTGVLVTTHSPPLKSFRCIHSGCFSLQLKLTRSHPKDVSFFGSFLSSGTSWPT